MKRVGRTLPFAGLVAILCCSWATSPAAAQTAAEPPVFCLDITHNFRVMDNGGETQVTIIREMARQAMLIAARHELGQITRDAVIGDTMPTSGAYSTWLLDFEPEEPNKITLFSGQKPPLKEQGSFTWSTKGVNRYRLMYASWEEKSRTEFPALLSKAGVKGAPLTWKPEAAVAEDIEPLLEQMTLISQFRAARKLHTSMREDGESPARLAALVRCYANLGVLTETHWSQERHVYLARSVLYGQRLVAKQPENASALWHRGYAYSLSGMHQNALEDWEEAEKAPDRAGAALPYWIEAAQHNVRSDLDALAQLKAREPKGAQLCDLLRYHVVEQSDGANYIVTMALETLPNMPECYRIHDGLCTFGGVSVKHGATAQAPQILASTIYTRLDEIDDLPPAVKKRVKEGTGGGGILGNIFGEDESPEKEFKLRNKVIKALWDASDVAAKPDPKNAKPSFDTSEPSWAALGKMINEVSFLQVMRRITFESDSLAVDPEQSVAFFRPLVAQHPYRGFLDTRNWDLDEKLAAVKTLQGSIDYDTLEIHASPLYHTIWACDKEAGKLLYDAAWSHQSNTLWELVVRHRLSPQNDEDSAEIMKVAMPYSPLGRLLQIEDQWDQVKEHAADWERESQSWPLVLRALGLRYSNEQQWDAAERCFQRAVEVDPSLESHRSLAAMYRKRGDKDRWLATLEAYLDKPDYGLGHAQVRVQIADAYAYDREWDKAVPYANEAAETWAGWALSSAGCTHEALEDFETAEQWFANLSERYRSSALEWYFFCRRTGSGRLDEAMEMAESASVERGTLDNADLGTFLVLQDQPAEAVDLFLVAFERNEWHADYGLSAAFAAHAAGDYQRRDEILQMVKEKSPSYVVSGPNTPRTDLLGLTDMMIAGFDGEKAKPLDIAAVEKLPFERNKLAEISFRYFVGKYEMIAGEKAEAIRQFKIAVASPEPADNERTLAAVELRTLGVAPEDYLGLLRTGFPVKEGPSAEAK
ncbi:MAG: hypothetical protein SGJ19_08475 [Planctomycetia bacterium]|nr:hypothetical protein [Planctomycetia bacterium]